MNLDRRRCRGVLAAVIMWPSFACGQGAASGYPSKPVRVIISSTAGGNTDIQARIFSSRLSESFNRQFVVDNRPGRNIAWTLAARAPADGYTLLVILADFIYGPAIYKDHPIDPVRDFAPVSLMSRTPYLLVINPSLPAKSVPELIALGRAQPGRLNFGGGVSGTAAHLIAAYFFTLTGIKATYVAYKGVPQAVVDLVAGQIDAGFMTASSMPYIRSGKLRAVGISTSQRSTVLPEIPTIAEQGAPGFDASAFHGWAAPAGTPSAIIAKLSAELAKVAKLAEVAQALGSDNSEPVGSTPEEFRQFIAAELPRWRKLVRDSGIKADY